MQLLHFSRPFILLTALWPKACDLYDGGPFHLQPSLPLLNLLPSAFSPSAHSSSFFSEIDQIFALRGPRPVYFLECVFSSGRSPCSRAQQCRLRRPSVWLSGWRPRGLVSGCSECALATLAALPSIEHTGPVGLTHTAAIHSTKHTQDRVWIVWRPVAMPGMLSPSSSLGKNGIWFSLPLSFSLWKVCSSLMRGITRCISRPVSSSLQIPARLVREGLPARGFLRRATAFHTGISWPSPTSQVAHSQL